MSFDPDGLAKLGFGFVKISTDRVLRSDDPGAAETFRALKQAMDSAGVDLIVENIETEQALIELLDHKDSLRELRGLQLELLPGGSTRIGHAGSGKGRDDYADAMALVVSQCRSRLEAADASKPSDAFDNYLRADYERLYPGQDRRSRRRFGG